MSKYGEEFIGVATYVFLITIFGLLALCFWIVECRRRRRFVTAAVQNSEMTKVQAHTLYEIRGNRTLLQPDSDKRFRHLDAFQTRNFHAENFYQLHRWIKNLKEAKRTGQLDMYTDQLIRDMETRMHIFPLSSTDQKRLWEVSMLPEETLNKYDHGHSRLLQF